MPPRRESPPESSRSDDQSGTPASRDKLQELIDGLPEEKKVELVKVLQVTSSTETTFSGPLPRPEDFGNTTRFSRARRIAFWPWPRRNSKYGRTAKRECSPMTAEESRALHGSAFCWSASPGLPPGWAMRSSPFRLASPERSPRSSAESWTGWSVAGMPMDLNDQASNRQRAA